MPTPLVPSFIVPPVPPPPTPSGGTTIRDLETGVLDRLEETQSDCKFWDVANEIRPLLIEAMLEATLLTAEPEKRSASVVTLAAGTTLFSAPDDAIAVVRLQSAYATAIQRTSIRDLDQQYPGWHLQTGRKIQYWFPFGLTAFGIYPKLEEDVDVFLTYVQLPVTVDPPYTGMEAVPFQAEYEDAFEDYASGVAALKEGGAELQQGIVRYESFLKKMQELSRFVTRKSPIRFTRRGGFPSTAATGQ